MRLLFDARSVRTPAGLEVFRGLTSGWLRDGRVSAVIAAVRDDFDRRLVPRGIGTVLLRRCGWLRHLWSEVGAVARLTRADIVFSPNGLQPHNGRAVLYFQDLHHFGRPFARDVGPLHAARWAIRRLSHYAAARLMGMGVCVSREIQHLAEERLGVGTRLIPNGVDVAGIRWCGDPGLVFVMGGFGARKAELTALQAWARLPQLVRSGRRLLIGGVEPASRRSRLAALAQGLQVEKSVLIRGSMSHGAFLECIAGAHVSIACSTLEGFGLPVAEALALGAPVLCSGIPAHLELIERARAGAAFLPGDATELSEMLHGALTGALPRQADVQLSEMWSWRVRAREHVDAYERFL